MKGTPYMQIELIRHGMTALQAEKRYQGITDAPLSEKGAEQLTRSSSCPDVVYVSPLRRARETAEILFPDARQIVIPDLAEMNFGVFEGHNYLEMADDPAYRAWVDGMCLGCPPGGESKTHYCERVCRAFSALLDQAIQTGRERLVITAHGGTQMAVLERFAKEKKDFYLWQLPSGHGYLLDAPDWLENKTLRVVGIISYVTDQD